MSLFSNHCNIKKTCRGLMLAHLFILSLSAHGQVIHKPDLEYEVTVPELIDGTIFYSDSIATAEDIEQNYPIFTDLDFKQTFANQNSRFLLAKYAFAVKAPIAHFNRQKIFKAKNLERVTKNTTTSNEKVYNENKLIFSMKKKVLNFSIKAQVMYEYFDRSQIDESPYQLAQSYSDQELSILTLQNMYAYSKIFNQSSNLCLFSEIEHGATTKVECYMSSAVKNSAYNSIGKIVNFKKQLKQEILYSISQIQKHKLNTEKGK